MSYVHGSRTIVRVGSNAVKCTSSALTREQDVHDIGSDGTFSHSYWPGLQNGKFTMSGVYDNTAGTGSKAIFEAIFAAQSLANNPAPAPTVITRQPEGVGSGKPQEVFDAWLTSYVETDPVADMITWQADWQITGDVDPTPQP